MDGIQLAKAGGVMFGRSKQLTPAQIAELQERRQQGVLIRTLMRDYHISKATRYLQTDSARAEGSVTA
jgi:DNA invertase Pin-like site-specific DNA recombinase